MPVRSSAGGPFCSYSFSQEVYLPDLWEIGLDPAVQGVPFKKKLSVGRQIDIHLGFVLVNLLMFHEGPIYQFLALLT